MITARNLPHSCIGLVALAMLVGCAHEPEAAAEPVPVAVHCVPVEARSWAPQVSFRGTVAGAPDHDAIIAAQVVGRLESVSVREGDAVTRGQIVATVERRAFQDALRQAQASMATARASRGATTAQVARDEHLHERGFTSLQALELSRASLAQSEAGMAAAAAAIDAAQQNLARATVRSPFDGVVVRLTRRAGEVVDGTSATPILEVADPAFVELAGSVAPDALVALSHGQTATITFDALPGRSWRGHVESVSPGIDPASGVGTARIAIEPNDRSPPFGLLGDVTVVVGETVSVLVVPPAAVRNAGGAVSEVVACESGLAHVVAVTIGVRRDGVVELASGGTPEMRVAIDEVTGLEDGTPITEAP